MSEDEKDYKQEFYRLYRSTHVEPRKASAAAPTLKAFKRRYSKWDRLIGPFLPAALDSSIVDCGAGNGQIVAWLLSKGYSNAFGVDGSAEEVKAAEAIGVPVTHGNIVEFLRNEKASLDFLILRNVLEHHSKPEIVEMLSLASESLRDGGTVFIQVPNAETPFGARLRYADFTHEVAFTASSISQVLRVCGFCDIETGPIRQTFRGWRQRLLWKLIERTYKTLLYAESHDKNSIVTMDLFAVGRVRRSRGDNLVEPERRQRLSTDKPEGSQRRSTRPGIMLVGNYPPPYGGVPTHIKYLSEYLAHRGWQVHVLPGYMHEQGLKKVSDSIFLHRPNREERFAALFEKRNRIEGFSSKKHLYPNRRKYISMHSELAYMKKVALDHDVRIISAYHVFGYASNAAHICEDLGIPMVTSIFGEIYSDTAMFLERIDEVEFVAKHTARWLSCSDHCAKSMSLLGLPIDVETLHYGIDTNDFNPQRSRLVFRERLSIAEQDRVVIFVGRMKDDMGLGVLLDAVPNIMEVRDDVHFLIVGPKGPLMRSVAALKKVYPENIHMAKNLPHEDLPFAYAAADVAVAPSINARACLGLAIAEALATAKPVIGCDVGGTREILVDGEMGLVIPPKDPYALRDAILSLVDDDAAIAAMGARGREHVVQHFDKELTNNRMENIIHEIIGEPMHAKTHFAQSSAPPPAISPRARLLARSFLRLITASDSLKGLVKRPKRPRGVVRRLVLKFVPGRAKQTFRLIIKDLVAAEIRGQRKQLRYAPDDVRTAKAVLLRSNYRSLDDTSTPLRLVDFETRIYSQNGEDGIIAHLLDAVGLCTRTFVEFGVQDGRECNCANLAVNFGWSGLMMDADAAFVERAREFYAGVLSDPTKLRIEERHITRENINDILTELGTTGEIDLLSIDIDGNDFWVWKNLEVVHPRVVVIEYNASMGPERSLTVKYDPDFVRRAKHPSGYYHGASLVALTKLANEKGYALVGCDSTGVNAFFVRRDLLADSGVPELTPAQAYYPHSRRCREATTAKQFATVSHLPHVEV